MQYPVTVQEYMIFINSLKVNDSRIWCDIPQESIPLLNEVRPDMWGMQLRQPNDPVGGISYFEALAYCRWLSTMEEDDFYYELPSLEELLGAGHDSITGQVFNDIRFAKKFDTVDFDKQNGISFGKVPVGSVSLKDFGFNSDFDSYSINFEWTKGCKTETLKCVQTASVPTKRQGIAIGQHANIVIMRERIKAHYVAYKIEATGYLSSIGFRCVRKKRKSTDVAPVSRTGWRRK
jgi:formylglycine-generating enzyme required for sulfatase activity